MCGRFLLGFLLVKHPDFSPSFFLQPLSEKLCSPLAFYPICSESLEVNNCFVPPPTGIHSYQQSAVQSVPSTFLSLSPFPPPPSDLPPLPPRWFHLRLGLIPAHGSSSISPITSSLPQPTRPSNSAFPVVAKCLSKSFSKLKWRSLFRFTLIIPRLSCTPFDYICLLPILTFSAILREKTMLLWLPQFFGVMARKGGFNSKNVLILGMHK